MSTLPLDRVTGPPGLVPGRASRCGRKPMVTRPVLAALATLALLPAAPGQAQVCRVTLPIGPGHDVGTAVGIQADGKIVMAGYSSNGTDDQFVVVRYNPGFTLDSSFDRDGVVTTNISAGQDRAEALLIQPDGKIVVAGHKNSGAGNNDFAVVRYNTDGSLDTTFNPGGAFGGPPNLPGIVTTAITPGHDEIEGVALQADLRIVVAGWTQQATTDYVVARYNPDGSLDTAGFNAPTGYFISTNGATNDGAYEVAVTSTGKVAIAGWVNSGTSDDFAAARFTTTGVPDPAFGGTGTVFFDFAGNRRDRAITLVTQPGVGGAPDFGEDRLTLAGEARLGNGFDMFALMRMSGDGALDGTFGTGGKASQDFNATLHDAAYGIALQPAPGSEIVLGGWASWDGFGTGTNFALARFTSAGVLDTATFNPPAGTVTTNFPANNNDWIDAVALQSDGKIVAAGYSHNGSNNDLALARYTAAGVLDTSCAVPINHRSIGTAANDTAGSVTATTGSAIVSGAGTSWLAGNRGRGDRITIDAQTYTVLRVLSDTELQLTSVFNGVSGSGKAYTIARQFRGAGVARQALLDWEDCIDGGPCAAPAIPVASSSLVSDNRSEIGIAYKDSVYTAPLDTELLRISGATADALHALTLTADEGNRHYGIPGNGVQLQFTTGSTGGDGVEARGRFVTIEWMEIVGLGPMTVEADGIEVSETGEAGKVTVRHNLIHHVGAGIQLQDAPADVDIYNNIIYDTEKWGILVEQPLVAARILNNTVFNGGKEGIFGDPDPSAAPPCAPACTYPMVLLRNNLVHTTTDPNYDVPGPSASSSHNLSQDATATAHSPAGGARPNVPLTGAGGVNFVSTVVGSEDLHLQGSSFAIDKGAELGAVFIVDVDAQSRPQGANTWDIGADEFAATTAVELLSFEAWPLDSAVDLVWRTASELDNLGCHLYRSFSGSGPWERITPSLIPGLGSSPMGASYSWTDAGLVNGSRYFYRLEDVDTSSVSAYHGPVSAVPQADLPGPGSDDEPDEADDGSSESEVGGGEGGSGGSSEGSGAEESDPGADRSGSTAGDSGALPACGSDLGALPCVRTYGDPSSVEAREVLRTSSRVVLELWTGGFVAVHEADGRVRVSVPGFEEREDPHDPALPFKRMVLAAPVGRRVRVSSVDASEEEEHAALVPVAVGYREMEVRPDGTVRPGRRTATLREHSGGSLPRELVRLEGTGFLGETKQASLELSPVRFDVARGAIVLTKRLRVHLDFVGSERLESGTGSRGRRLPRPRPGGGETLAFLHTSRKGLHAVAFETLFPGRTRGLSPGVLDLRRQGESVPFHLEPEGSSLGPGSALYFFADRGPESTSYGGEVAYELVRATGGQPMAEVEASPFGEALTAPSLGPAVFETNRIYQSGLLEAEDLWQWEALLGGASKTKAFDLVGVDAASGRAGRVVVWLQGASDADGVVDHHVEVSLNGTLLGEASFDGKRPFRFASDVPPFVLHEGVNELTVTNAGDTGVYSLVFLDRFEVDYPQATVLRGGAFEGEWSEDGVVQIALPGPPGSALLPSLVPKASFENRAGGSPTRDGETAAASALVTRPRPSAWPEETTLTSGTDAGFATRGRDGRGLSRVPVPPPPGAPPSGVLSPSSVVAVDVTDPSRPSWLVGLEPGPGMVSLRAKAGRRYAIAGPEGVLSPRVSTPVRSSLGSETNQADWVLIAPEAFLGVAEPLVERRTSQGLATKAVSVEEIASAFGHGEVSAEAIRSFLTYAYHTWRRPSPRYVVLLGDASHDPRNFIGSSGPAPLPALFLKTSYLVTASDPALGAVNGEDLLPDLAIGRLPAQTMEEAEALVRKLLTWEDTGQGLEGRAVIVADNPDEAGDFEANARDIAESFLAGRSHQTILLSEEGAETRARILDAFDAGPSLVSYVGHGGAAVWASENVLNSWDAESLRAQSAQPLMLTLNCLNGYFVAPGFDSLSEAYLKAEGRGTIGAFSPSGLSLDGPAHELHKALVKELVSGSHDRLGDAVLAAQQRYAETGLMPELLSIYHLLGDPATLLK